MQGYLSQIKNIVLKFAYVHFKRIKFSKVVLHFCWFTEKNDVNEEICRHLLKYAVQGDNITPKKKELDLLIYNFL